jgi:hypothetical protein
MSLIPAQATCPDCGSEFEVQVRVRSEGDCSAISPSGEHNCDLKDDHLPQKHEANWTDTQGEKHTLRWSESEGLEASR